MWFVYDPEGNGYEEFKTEQEAKERAEAYLKGWIKDAAEEGEWMDDGLPCLRWGKVMARGKLVKAERPWDVGDDGYDGILESA